MYLIIHIGLNQSHISGKMQMFSIHWFFLGLSQQVWIENMFYSVGNSLLEQERFVVTLFYLAHLCQLLTGSCPPALDHIACRSMFSLNLTIVLTMKQREAEEPWRHLPEDIQLFRYLSTYISFWMLASIYGFVFFLFVALTVNRALQ